MSDAAAAPEEDGAPKKGKPIVLILVLVNVLLGGGAAAFFFLRGSASAAPPPAEHAEAGAEGADGEHASPVAPTKAVGPIIEFRPTIVNLNEPEGTRYLKTTIAVQLANEQVAADVEKLKPVIHDHFIRELSELNFRQTMGNKNKMAIKARLLKRFNEAVGTEAGTEVHLTEFIVQ